MDTIVPAINITLRPFAKNDYATITDLHNRTFAPEFQFDADKFRFQDEHRPAHCRQARWVAVVDGQVVGLCGYTQSPARFDPRKFDIHITVHPEFQNRGIGQRLYTQLMEALQEFNPSSVSTWTREDMPCRVGFLERRGFEMDQRLWACTLDLASYDPVRFAHLPAVVEAQGIELRPLADLGVADRDVVWRKIYELWCEVRWDVPQPPGESQTDISFEDFRSHEDRPILLSAGTWIAADRGTYVGLTELYRSPEGDTLRTGLTAVLGAYRRRGIAFALKARSLETARSLGYRRVITDNESNNHGMLAINQQLGFRKHPAWLHYVRVSP
jgi:GNAT superfamily N-acetyltransferase